MVETFGMHSPFIHFLIGCKGLDLRAAEVAVLCYDSNVQTASLFSCITYTGVRLTARFTSASTSSSYRQEQSIIAAAYHS